jgi:predicted small metal-binding protein
MKEFNCRDMGYDCDFNVRGDNQDEMMSQIEGHGRSSHGLTEFTQDLKDKVLSKFRDVMGRDREKVA